ncbi:MAG: glycosyltransferase family 2 protein [Prevotella sp.]|nr:glycosyltransferase family 2 protein [Prevotella sp.]
MISVVCPIYNEEKYIAKCIDSILEQDFPHDNMEVLFVDGMSSDRTREIVLEYTEKYKFIRLLDNPHRTSPYAMNIGIENATGDTIFRMDAHAQYPNNYLSELYQIFQELPNAENVGGVCETLPCNDTNEAYAIAEVLSNSFGMGNSYFRTGVSEIRKVDTVPFGCFHKSLFKRIGLYDTDLDRNQDDELNGRIIRNGGSIYIIPSIKIKYFARDKMGKVRKMFYQYGLYKPLVNKKLGAPATLRQFVPVLFLLGIVLGAVACYFWPTFRWIYLALACLYMLICFSIGIRNAVKHKRPSLAILIPYALFNTHISYGWGYLHGIFKILFKQPFNVKSNR